MVPALPGPTSSPEDTIQHESWTVTNIQTISGIAAVKIMELAFQHGFDWEKEDPPNPPRKEGGFHH